jgi:hypothetical protein
MSVPQPILFEIPAHFAAQVITRAVFIVRNNLRRFGTLHSVRPRVRRNNDT